MQAVGKVSVCAAMADTYEGPAFCRFLLRHTVKQLWLFLKTSPRDGVCILGAHMMLYASLGAHMMLYAYLGAHMMMYAY